MQENDHPLIPTKGQVRRDQLIENTLAGYPRPPSPTLLPRVQRPPMPGQLVLLQAKIGRQTVVGPELETA
jgi:hypothetical protein